MTTEINDEFWRESWVANRIGFHRTTVNPTLIKYTNEMTAGQEKCRILVPLSGKSQDMKWLAEQGHTVIGVELSSIAIQDFFKESQMEYSTKPVDGLSDVDLYTSKDSRILLYKANIFDLDRDILGEFDCIWDRASIVALQRTDLQRYVDVMTRMLKTNGRCLLVTLDYDQSEMNGPPFSTPMDTVQKLYAANWDLKPLEVSDGTNDKWRSRGLSAMTNTITLLTKKEK